MWAVCALLAHAKIPSQSQMMPPQPPVIEKKRPQMLEPHGAPLDKGDAGRNERFVFLLVPQSDGLRLMRADVDRLLEIAQPVALVPHELSDRNVPFLGQIELPHFPLAGRTPAREREDIPAAKQKRAGSRANTLKFAHVEIDEGARVVMKAGELVQLAPLEFDLLLALFNRDGAAASRSELMREVWGGGVGGGGGGKKRVTSRTVDTHIFNLRRKLETDPSRPRHLLTVSKVGYRLRA